MPHNDADPGATRPRLGDVLAAEQGGGEGRSLPAGITAEGCGVGDPWVKAATEVQVSPGKAAGRQRRSAAIRDALHAFSLEQVHVT